ncbi:MAG: hypothetical protein EZS28_019037 [Streblomastix strix]|uniref:Uncharacterized protein n=1 Tax=Streblomastix strix TaxID=222440 RepID=A0A5J4VTC8_9EUKA|nr:MAG: hypothetical protein EZS28_019037 [Streblomastix strix]
MEVHASGVNNFYFSPSYGKNEADLAFGYFSGLKKESLPEEGLPCLIELVEFFQKEANGKRSRMNQNQDDDDDNDDKYQFIKMEICLLAKDYQVLINRRKGFFSKHIMKRSHIRSVLLQHQQKRKT